MKYEAVCTHLNNEGEGEFKFKGASYSCPNFLVKEKALVEIYPPHAKLKQLLTQSKQRIEPDCAVFNECGGCQMRHLSYQDELMFKQDKVNQLFKGDDVLPIVGATQINHYRNKVIGSFSYDQKRRVIVGQYAKSSHRVVKNHQCNIQNQLANRILKTSENLMNQMKIAPFDVDRQTGVIRHVLIRTNTQSKALVCFVLGTQKFKERNAFFGALKKAHPEIESIVSNFNNRKTSVVLGDKEIINFGNGYIEDRLCGMKFKIYPKTFYQIHHDQTEKLYSKAIEMCQLTKNDRVLDAYCGIGTISLYLSKYAKEVVGVEVNKDSVRSAIQNCKDNNINNVFFIAEDCTKYMIEAAKRKEHFDCVVLDPAREGVTSEFVDSLSKLSVKKIVYISCNPLTQKRDIDLLVKKGYIINEIQPFDLFPRTFHVECVVLMSRKSI